MKTLLLYPSFPDTFWSFKHALKFIRKRSAFPPLGLLTVAAMLPANWSKRLIDLNVNPLTEKDMAWADCAFVSAMAVQRESARTTIARCKKAGLKVVAGGPLFTDEHKDFGDVDHFVLNEAELTLPSFLRDLKSACPQRLYQTSAFADLSQTPPPLWHLIDMKRYAAMSIQFSRGCPFNCDFCNITALLGHRPRHKTAAQIITELDGLYGLGWRGNIFFVDDNFISNKKYLKDELLPALIQWQKDKKSIRFNTEASVNLADDRVLIQMMVTAGFESVFIGIETPAEEALTECNKKQNKGRNLVESVKRIHRSGLQVQGGFIVGFDSDTPSIFQRQIDFIQKSGIVTAMVGLLNAPPGTRLYNRLKKEGRLAGLVSCNTDGTTNIIPRMDLKALSDGYKRIMGHIYSPGIYYDRVRTFLKEYKAPEAKLPFSIHDLMAFLRSCIRLGIFGKERFQYWKLLLWTLRKRPELL
ncbi:MAG: B12-binding domain-containing radical SAM protein, partial [Deltaproteobacteria bacterium]|nr:B12-binding domain-containing radical SAM protein [Deltaproteobacteria bacterium]